MLIRLISVISLFQFMLLLLSGTDTSVALYRSILVFTILFTVVYMGIFFLNVIRGNTDVDPDTVEEMKKNKSSNNKSETKTEGRHG
ncbi:MAG: hypothetical protein R6V27_08300 [Balneolaceae bacterium]